MTDQDVRIMRVPIPVRLIREIDSLILGGVGGYSTRAEFVVDAIEERILELTVPGEVDAGEPKQRSGGRAAEGAAWLLAPAPASRVLDQTDASTVLPEYRRGFAVGSEAEIGRPENRVLFGLHNRDYPSLWSLAQLASIAEKTPVAVELFHEQVLAAAWRFGESLVALERHDGVKRTAIFPTNPEKRKPAEAAFLAFAIGGHRYEAEGALVTTGPLFEWRAAALVGDPESPLIGLTNSGWDLLDAVGRLSVREPHDAGTAFLDHIRRNAPVDWSGFVTALRAVGPRGCRREDVLLAFADDHPTWTPAEVSTNAAGYIARSREWGMIKGKQTNQQYHLTALGIDYLNGVSE